MSRKMMFVLFTVSVAVAALVIIVVAGTRTTTPLPMPSPQPPPRVAWEKTFTIGGQNARWYNCAVRQTKDGGFIVAAWVTATNWVTTLHLIKTDATGHLHWQQHHTCNRPISGSVEETSDGEFLVTGWRSEADPRHIIFSGSTAIYSDYHLERLKTDASGKELERTSSAHVLRTRAFPGEEHRSMGGRGISGASVVKKIKNGYVLLTHTQHVTEGPTLWVVPTDDNGHAGSGHPVVSTAAVGHSVSPTADDGYVVTGYTTRISELPYDVLLCKYDRNHNGWMKTFDGMGRDTGRMVQPTNDGGYVVVGSTTSSNDASNDVYLIKTDANGKLLWQEEFGGTSRDEGYSVQQTSDDGYVVAGWTESFGTGGQKVYLIKLFPDGGGPTNVSR